jgi:hypothetical protein
MAWGEPKLVEPELQVFEADDPDRKPGLCGNVSGFLRLIKEKTMVEIFGRYSYLPALEYLRTCRCSPMRVVPSAGKF